MFYVKRAASLWSINSSQNKNQKTFTSISAFRLQHFLELVFFVREYDVYMCAHTIVWKPLHRTIEKKANVTDVSTIQNVGEIGTDSILPKSINRNYWLSC